MTIDTLSSQTALVSAKSRLPLLGLLLVIGLAAAAWYSWKTPYGFDDTWITYRYSKNIALGHGYVYNLGERVQGTSTPLYTLILALAGVLAGWQVIPEASMIISLLSFCLSTVLIVLVGQRLHSRLAGVLAAAMFLASPAILRTATSGMETGLYCALILLSFYLYLSQKLIGAFVVGSFCALIRLDGGLVLAVLTGMYLIERRQLPWRALALPAVFLLAWFSFAFFYFGSLLPASFIAKQYHTGHHKISLWMLYALIENRLIFLAAMAGLVALWLAKARQAVPLLIWSLLYVLAYSVAELDFYPWYVSPALVMLYIAAGIGLGALISSLFNLGAVRNVASPNVLRLGTAAAAVLVSLAVNWQALPAWKYRYIYPIEAARWEGAQYSAQYMQTGVLDVSGGIGMIGWFHDGPIVDFAGLVSPQTLHRFPQPYFMNSLTWCVVTYKPRYVFDAVQVDPGWPQVVKDNYHVVRSFPIVSPDPADVTVYKTYEPFILWERNSPSKP